ncbi:Tad domain-containing protein [Oceaniovalibus sp. ACAM 378]|uniref:Tad domain-containing protein n=1 Tax=Oceaniovalibus sp. ACAM 378 TaxID=2599923 RepID=UPI0011DA1792|nr:Tad domain-containing protein [Oceaniovalibus sp. ACAM 378]TYB87665.1 hypothetical protein FQ320_13745 [Oceaniovalibus sp. ACAM 378]
MSQHFDTKQRGSANDRVTFLDDEAGSLTILALFFFICMVIIGGISIDIMMFENNRTRLQNLSDRAALAAADLDQTVPAAVIVGSYFEKEGLADYLKDVQVTQSVNQRSVRVDTEKTQKTMFLNFWNHTGVDTLTPRSLSVATELRTDMEISLVLDVSNSMNWASSAPGSSSKLADLKSAATRFVDKIYNTEESERITMNLVPYATHVNAGPAIMDELGVTAKHPYSNCLAFADADFNETLIRGGDAYEHTMHFDQWYTEEKPQLYVCPSEADQIVRPFLHDPVEIKQHINSLTANGNTSIEIGMKWGAAFLDPSARNLTQRLINDGDVDSAYDERPYGWDRSNTEKFIVVLTDGVNTVQQEINSAYATGPSGVWRWTPNPAVPVSFYSWSSPEIGDEDGDRIANERYWNRRVTLPRSVTGIAPITIPQGWSNLPLGQNPGAINAALTAALPQSQPPVQLDYSELWNEMSVRHFATLYVRGQRGSSWSMNRFYNDVWRDVLGPTKDARLLDLCNQTRTKGATVFTIGFEVTDHSASVMSQCASTPNYFIRVVGDDLEDAFDAIAASITKLRLTQ